jgi:hypothetical protein
VKNKKSIFCCVYCGTCTRKNGILRQFYFLRFTVIIIIIIIIIDIKVSMHTSIEYRWKETDGHNEQTKQVRKCACKNIEAHSDLCILDSL